MTTEPAMMITFGVPDDERVLAAVGRVAIRHGQMDYALRMVVKTLTGVPVEIALAATEKVTSGPLRDRIEKLAKRRLGDGPAFVKLQALLADSRRLTDRRNELLHGLWAVNEEGEHLIRSDGERWTKIPRPPELEQLADDIFNLIAKLNGARLEGFLDQALKAAKTPDWV
jgi:hypothetical protein